MKINIATAIIIFRHPNANRSFTSALAPGLEIIYFLLFADHST